MQEERQDCKFIQEDKLQGCALKRPSMQICVGLCMEYKDVTPHMRDKGVSMCMAGDVGKPIGSLDTAYQVQLCLRVKETRHDKDSSSSSTYHTSHRLVTALGHNL